MEELPLVSLAFSYQGIVQTELSLVTARESPLPLSVISRSPGTVVCTHSWNLIEMLSCHHLIIVGSVNSLLDVHILATEFLNFPLDCVLHEMLGLMVTSMTRLSLELITVVCNKELLLGLRIKLTISMTSYHSALASDVWR